MSKKKIDIEKILSPKANTLQIVDGLAKAEILDAELDTLDCSFNYDGCVQIDTENLSYIVLTPENLTVLQKLIDEAEEYYSTHPSNEENTD